MRIKNRIKKALSANSRDESLRTRGRSGTAEVLSVKRGLVKTDEHHMVALSPEGTKSVHVILAKRVVMKAFLVNVLGVPEAEAEIDSCKVEHLLSDESGHRLVQFMRFLSCDPSWKKLLTRFRRFDLACPDSRACDVCQGRCLMDELDRAI